LTPAIERDVGALKVSQAVRSAQRFFKSGRVWNVYVFP
jgi:hypothetical protein